MAGDAGPAGDTAPRRLSRMRAGMLRPGRRLVMVTAGIVVLFLLLGAVTAWRGYQQDRSRVRNELALAASASAADAERFLQEQISTLQAVSASRAVRAGEDTAIREYFLRVMAARTSFADISLIDRAGNVRVTTAADSPPAGVALDRVALQSAGDNSVPYISAAATGPGGSPSITIAVPATDGQDQPAGAIAARITAARLGEQLVAFREQHANLVVVDRAGQVLTGAPRGMVLPAAEVPVVQRARREPAGVADGVAGPLGRSGQLVAWSSAPAGGWTLFLVEPASSAFGPSWRTLLGTLAALAGAACAGVAGAVWAGRRLDRDAAARRAAEAEVVHLLERERAARAEVVQALQLRDEVVSTLSHDLRSPLTTIKGYAQLLSRQLGGSNARASEGLARIDSSCARMEALFDEVVDTARLQSGRPLDLRRHRYDLAAQVRQAVEDRQRTVSTHTFHASATPAEIMGWWDEVRLGRVLDNLLSNAIKYSPDGGTVTVNVTQTDGHVALRVADQGVGIPAAELARITERFYRASNVTGRFNGTGIGLAGVRQIVEQHDGRLTIGSTEGQGTTVTVTLPVSEQD